MLSKFINSFFLTLDAKPEADVLKHKDDIYRCLTYLVLDEERIFQVENYLSNSLIEKIFKDDAALKKSWAQFTSGDLKAASDFYKHNEKYFKEDDLTLEDIKDKMRFYKISQVADKTQQMTLKALSEQIDCSEEEAELFLIKASQYGYVTALVDQMEGMVYFREVHKRNLLTHSKAEILAGFDSIANKFKRVQTSN